MTLSTRSKEPINHNYVETTERLYDYSKEVVASTPTFYLKRMKRTDAEGYYRENMFGKEIIWGTTKFSFNVSKAKKIRKQLFIFALVKKDALKFLEKNKRLKKPKPIPAVMNNHNIEISDKKIMGTDVDGAYWIIAYQIGLISENTYHHGLRINNKPLCLAALAALGRDKSYLKIENGTITDKVVIVKGNDKLKAAYNTVRFTCFQHMKVLAGKLGSDFICYKTDCIYYIKTPENKKIVTHYLEQNKLDYKLVYSVKDMEKDDY